MVLELAMVEADMEGDGEGADTLQLSIVSYPPCRSGDGYRIPEAAAACRSLEANPTSRPRTADLVLQHLERMNGRIVAPPIGRVTRLDRR